MWTSIAVGALFLFAATRFEPLRSAHLIRSTALDEGPGLLQSLFLIVSNIMANDIAWKPEFAVLERPGSLEQGFDGRPGRYDAGNAGVEQAQGFFLVLWCINDQYPGLQHLPVARRILQVVAVLLVIGQQQALVWLVLAPAERF